tara:strand:- start:694 stop:2256 length:1563 start_codon:yes stop_codon:yes gene_type:complete
MNLFGFEIKRKDEDNLKSFVQKDEDDGAINISSVGAAGGAYGTYIDMEANSKNEAELVTKYRNMAMHPEVQKAIDDIVNETIIVDDLNSVVEINLDNVELSDKIKKRITEEFNIALELLDFSNEGYDIFQRFYVDGRLRFHAVVDEKDIKSGIQELRYVDPRRLRKVREISSKKDSSTQAITKSVKNEYYIYSEKGFNASLPGTQSDGDIKGIRIAKDSIVEVTSGILNENNTLVLSHLQKAIKPLNQLKMLEDAVVIYRISRAPERRIFYIDVGNLPKIKAEQYLREMMVKHKNRLVYDATTGEVRDDRKHMTMLEDFWLPRREGGKGTEITTLPGGQTLGEMDDVLYFQKSLYRSLNVPVSRMEADTGFSLGRSSEISRDEVKFSKFIGRLRTRFSILFDEILEKQLVLKNVMTIEEWLTIKNTIRYNFQEDNHFSELKDAEILRDRLQSLDTIQNYVGEYYSKEWVRKNILKMSEEDVEKIKEQIETEAVEEPDEDAVDDNTPTPNVPPAKPKDAPQ